MDTSNTPNIPDPTPDTWWSTLSATELNLVQGPFTASPFAVELRNSNDGKLLKVNSFNDISVAQMTGAKWLEIDVERSSDTQDFVDFVMKRLTLCTTSLVGLLLRFRTGYGRFKNLKTTTFKAALAQLTKMNCLRFLAFDLISSETMHHNLLASLIQAVPHNIKALYIITSHDYCWSIEPMVTNLRDLVRARPHLHTLGFLTPTTWEHKKHVVKLFAEALSTLVTRNQLQTLDLSCIQFGFVESLSSLFELLPKQCPSVTRLVLDYVFIFSYNPKIIVEMIMNKFTGLGVLSVRNCRLDVEFLQAVLDCAPARRAVAASTHLQILMKDKKLTPDNVQPFLAKLPDDVSFEFEFEFSHLAHIKGIVASDESSDQSSSHNMTPVSLPTATTTSSTVSTHSRSTTTTAMVTSQESMKSSIDLTLY
jgi:hypothetical protein